MSVSEQFLLIVDFPSIKQFVFGTDRLVEIRGGSGILDHMNRLTLPRFLEDELGPSNVECVYAGGGAGQFVVRGNQESIQGALGRLRSLCREESGGGLHLLYTLTPFSADYVQTKNRAYQQLRRLKEEDPLRLTVSDHVGFVRDCDSCSRYAVERVVHGGSARLLCASCAAKTHAGRDNVRDLWGQLAQYLTRFGHDEKAVMAARPGDFKEVGQACSAKKGHVGLIYADGNSMGRLVKEIDSRENFSFFSQTVDTAIREACYEAIERRCILDGQVHRLIPALILLLGGDDLLVYTPADLAVPVALEAARIFEDKTREAFRKNPFFQKKLEGRGLTISMGIAFGRHNTPFSMLLNQAEELLRSAKARGSLDKRCTDHYAPSYVDYHFSAQFNQVRAMDCRRENQVIKWGKESLHLTHRPYSLEDMAALWEEARTVSQSGMPRSRMKRMGTAPTLGKVQANLQFYTLLSRTHQKTVVWKALERFGCRLDEAPWVQKDDTLGTVLGDLMELVEITPKS